MSLRGRTDNWGWLRTEDTSLAVKCPLLTSINQLWMGFEVQNSTCMGLQWQSMQMNYGTRSMYEGMSGAITP